MTEQDVLLRRAAMDLLARREHSRKELHNKLRGRAEEPEVLEQVLDRLEEDNLLSDGRFVESFVRARIGKGHGPVRIRQELQQKGIAGEECQIALEEADVDWYELARDCRQRKFGQATPVDNRDRARQMRYLQYRGFEMDAINHAIRAYQD
ncbi:regulatory protein RecX [Parendozoicomonas haliclonae]|uniref:Regulatory protein RecX n=1 Tax=Parendozoicomonas haliclonae TaxID=1960125 RepID=A0A1X7AQV8_9GAMM|nr:regulatory protein RecX [Parendozoicomonas haliclonae]SMA50478.1 Regulatory protein RecX [Parendozoicomonas haliclonae]